MEQPSDPCVAASSEATERGGVARTARAALAAFLVTFAAARGLVLLIMLRALPDLYVHVHGTHVHHLNFGIVLLAAVGGWLLFGRPRGRWRTAAGILYGIGLALTFDEFGMWLHLGGGYWQRASYDAVVGVGGMLALIAVAPALRQFRPRHWIVAILIAVLVAAGLVLTLRVAERHLAPVIKRAEQTDPG